MTRTVIIRREYLHYVRKYNRYERRHKNLPVHVSPAFRVEVGDIIVAGMYYFLILMCTNICRPVPPAFEDGSLQRSQGDQEQEHGACQDVQPFLSVYNVLMTVSQNDSLLDKHLTERWSLSAAPRDGTYYPHRA